jgi:hypothetical protein
MTTDPSADQDDPEVSPIDPQAILLLPGAAGRIWRDAEERRHTIDAIVEALDGTDASLLQDAIWRMDDAIVAGLMALWFPRGRVRAVEIERSAVMWAGRKDPACTLFLSATALRRNLRLAQPNAVFRTWIHESLHARQPYAAGYAEEYRRTPGYEEGLVEGLSRELLLAVGGFVDVGGSFDYYVTAWQTLARLMSVPVYAVWQRLWTEPPGRVRANFAAAVNDLQQRQGKPVVSGVGLARLAAIADTLFSPARARAVPDTMMIERTWRLVLP